MPDEPPDDEAREADLDARFGPEALDCYRATREYLLKAFPGRTLGVDLSVDEVRASLLANGLLPEIRPRAH